MNIAVTGGTGFIGRYILRQLNQQGHSLKAWKRKASIQDGLEDIPVQWITGGLDDADSSKALVKDCDAVVHAAHWKPGRLFQGGEGNIAKFAEMNILGTLNLVRAAMDAGVQRFVFLSTCAVYDRILADRPLDESHPLWPRSHYGATKAAIEKFTHSYARNEGFNICSLRPCGVYGQAHPVEYSKYFELVEQVARGATVQVSKGGKEVHAADVAKAIEILLRADHVAGEAFNCYDRYISEYEVAHLAREISGSNAIIEGQPKQPAHQIATEKIENLGMRFGGRPLLERTIQQLVDTMPSIRD
ncbi:MAG: NAD(P)-dependent oxidoreductase [Pirellulaceae bacterium]|nr:NAD(P)-dependent oxidoreductase [Pirellulaceae bacterium]